MFKEHVGVPVQKEASIGRGVVVPSAIFEEGCVGRDGVVVACAVGTTISPV